MNFFSKLILYVTHDALTAGIWQFGRIKNTEKFSNNEDGVTRFKEFVKDFDDVNTYLLVDVVEEDYRQEILSEGQEKVFQANSQFLKLPKIQK